MYVTSTPDMVPLSKLEKGPFSSKWSCIAHTMIEGLGVAIKD